MMKKIIEINGRKIGSGYPPYIIAEVSANHNGSISTALETIRVAKECGADAVKIQTYTADTMTINCDAEDFQIKGGLWGGNNLYQLYKQAETPFEWHRELFEYARTLDITIFSTPFDETAVDLLESLDVPAYKIASFEATDLPLISYVALKKRPIIISTGMCDESEIKQAVEVASSAGNQELMLLHCISSYPAPIEHTNLLQMLNLARTFDTIPGLSDHTLGTTVSVAAVAIGACIIEKHFTLSRDLGGPDSDFSLEPAEFKSLCEDSYNAWLALGKSGFERNKFEVANKQYRRSIYFISDIKKGQIVTNDHIRRIRPGFGLSPKHYHALLGKKVNQDIKRGTPTSWDLFDE
jgi:N-acetylneuraminate synthase